MLFYIAQCSRQNLNMPMGSNSQEVYFCDWRAVKVLFSDPELVVFLRRDVHVCGFKPIDPEEINSPSTC